jgi:hypothetical protein
MKESLKMITLAAVMGRERFRDFVMAWSEPPPSPAPGGEEPATGRLAPDRVGSVIVLDQCLRVPFRAASEAKYAGFFA